MCAGLVQARGHRAAVPQRRLIEADFHPVGEGRFVLPIPMIAVYATGSTETMGLVVQDAME